MDQLKLASSWEPNRLKAFVNMEITGVQLQGALLDTQLREPLSTSPPVTTVPLLTIAWIPSVGNPPLPIPCFYWF